MDMLIYWWKSIFSTKEILPKAFPGIHYTENKNKNGTNNDKAFVCWPFLHNLDSRKFWFIVGFLGWFRVLSYLFYILFGNNYPFLRTLVLLIEKYFFDLLCIYIFSSALKLFAIFVFALLITFKRNYHHTWNTFIPSLLLHSTTDYYK